MPQAIRQRFSVSLCLREKTCPQRLRGVRKVAGMNCTGQKEKSGDRITGWTGSQWNDGVGRSLSLPNAWVGSLAPQRVAWNGTGANGGNGGGCRRLSDSDSPCLYGSVRKIVAAGSGSEEGCRENCSGQEERSGTGLQDGLDLSGTMGWRVSLSLPNAWVGVPR